MKCIGLSFFYMLAVTFHLFYHDSLKQKLRTKEKFFFLILSFYRYLLFTCLIPNKRKPPPIWKCSYVIKDKYYCAVSILENNLIGLFPRMTSTLWLAMPHCRKPVIPNHVLLYSQTPAFQASSEFPIILICHSLYTTYILSQ